IEWVLDQQYAGFFNTAPQIEQSVLVLGAMEAALTPLMQRIEQSHPGVRVFSLPSVDHPQYGRHIELGVKGAAAVVPSAWADLKNGLHDFGAKLGPELVRNL
ncbi:MAG: competence/damage-inducible protein A, partial [Ramlibacter sp.]|nr:competence/damage-inducible protein A [Ramlibacter sp.]